MINASHKANLLKGTLLFLQEGFLDSAINLVCFSLFFYICEGIKKVSKVIIQPHCVLSFCVRVVITSPAPPALVGRLRGGLKVAQQPKEAERA